ncbi:MAG TPA: hypothetical protein VGD81_05280 [Opitutaceae bacterium]
MEKKARWEDLTGMVKDVDALQAVSDELAAAAAEQAVTSRGATEAQQASRRELRRLVRAAGRLLARYADRIGSAELAANARVNHRALRRGSLMEVLPEARRVEALVKANPEALVGSVKDPDFAKTLGDAIMAFETVMGKPRLVIVARAVATDQIGKIIRRGQRLLKTLDALVEPFEDEDPALVVAWRHALKGRAPQRQPETEPEVATLTPTPEVTERVSA